MYDLGSLGVRRRSPTLGSVINLPMLSAAVSPPLSDFDTPEVNFNVCVVEPVLLRYHSIRNSSNALLIAMTTFLPVHPLHFYSSARSSTTPSPSVTPKIEQGYAKGSAYSPFSNNHPHGLRCQADLIRRPRYQGKDDVKRTSKSLPRQSLRHLSPTCGQVPATC